MFRVQSVGKLGGCFKKRIIGVRSLIEGPMDDKTDILLKDYNYPENYVDHAHPEDFILRDKPFDLEYMYNDRYGHKKLLIRTCFEVPDMKQFLPLTFVLDTSAPQSLYLGDKAMFLFQKYNIRKYDEAFNRYYATVFGGIELIEPSPSNHHKDNLIGLSFLMRLGLTLNETNGSRSFKFTNIPMTYFTDKSVAQ